MYLEREERDMKETSSKTMSSWGEDGDSCLLSEAASWRRRPKWEAQNSWKKWVTVKVKEGKRRVF